MIGVIMLTSMTGTLDHPTDLSTFIHVEEQCVLAARQSTQASLHA
jgi:hypothetical protein